MALTTFRYDSDATFTTLGEELFNLYNAVTSDYVGLSLAQQSEATLAAASLQQFTVGLSMKFDAIPDPHTSDNLFDFIAGMITLRKSGLTCSWTKDDFIYAIPNLRGEIYVDYDTGI